MIRINLLGQPRPKATRRAVPLEATLQYFFLVLSLVLAFGFLTVDYWQSNNKLKDLQTKIRSLQSQKAQLEQLKQQVTNFEKQKAILQQRINVIEELQRNRTGGQELLNALANTVVRTNTLWLTSLQRRGDALDIKGTAGSINAVAEFITQLKRSGYFQQVEIKETHQDEKNTAIQTFDFTLTTQFAPPQSRAAAPAAPARKG